jgi:hypothetical protein
MERFLDKEKYKCHGERSWIMNCNLIVWIAEQAQREEAFS